MATPDRGLWSRPVPIAAAKAGATLLVGNSFQACRVLLCDWPGKGGPKHLAARKAVLAAMEKALDRERQAAAAKAFREAAEEAGIARGDGEDER